MEVDSEAAELSARQVVRDSRFDLVLALGDVGRDLHALYRRNKELHVVDFVQLSSRQAGAVAGETILLQPEGTPVFGGVT